MMAVFVIAFVSALVIGMAQMNTEEVQVAQNQIYAAEALAITEAGLNDAFSELRADSSWNSGFSGKSFSGGTYDVTVTGSLPSLVVESTGTSAKSFVAEVSADITVGTASPYVIRVDNLRINE